MTVDEFDSAVFIFIFIVYFDMSLGVGEKGAVPLPKKIPNEKIT